MSPEKEKRKEKTDLHIHLDGSLSLEFVAERLKEMGQETDRRILAGKLSVPGDCRSLEEYLRCFDLPLQVLQSAGNLSAAAEDLVLRLDSQGLTYGEIRFAPQLHRKNGLTQQEAVEAVIAGMNAGMKKCRGFTAGLILCMMVTGDRRANEETAELAAAYRGRGAAGLDLAGAEGAVPLEEFRPLFEQAGRNGVPFTIHAGECGDPGNIRKAVSFGAVRIGHGCAAIKDPECMELLRREKIVLEMCPVSNCQTRAVNSIGEHPIRRFWEYGIRVTVNTDNMTVSDTNLEREYDLLKKQLGFTEEELAEMNRDARRAGFLQASPRA